MPPPVAVANVAPQTNPPTNPLSPLPRSNSTPKSASNQQPLSPSPSTPPQQSGNARPSSNPNQQSLSLSPPALPQSSRNVVTPRLSNPQLLSPPSSQNGGSITSNTTGSSSIVNTTNIPKPAIGSNTTASSQNPTPPANAASAYPAVPRYAFIENTLRAWSLGSLYAIGVKIGDQFTTHRRRILNKREHITLFKHRGVALWASLLHLLPIAATATITYYMNMEYFVGNRLAGQMGPDKFKLLGLQFAAKVHELLMISTLTNVVFAMVRHELSCGDGVPFAFLSAGLGVSRVSFLWSKDFVALCKARYATWYKKVLFLAAILVCVILSLAVAPASATALTPVRREWEAGGTKIWLSKTKEQIFPEILDGSRWDESCINASAMTTACPSLGWQTLSNGYLPLADLEWRRKGEISWRLDADNIFGVERNDVTEFALVLDGSGLQFNIVTLFGHAKKGQKTWRSAVIAPHTAVTNALVLNEKLWVVAAQEDMERGRKPHRFTERAGSSYKTTAMPLAAASTVCKMLYAPSRYNRKAGPRPWGPDLWDDAASEHINITEFLKWETSVNHFDYRKNTSLLWESKPQLFWLEVPPNTLNETSITAFISLVLDDDFTVFGCNVDARWVHNELVSKSARALPKPSNDKWYQEKEWKTQNSTQVNIRQSFANLTNVNTSGNKTAFHEMMEVVGVWNRDTDPDGAWPFRLETVLNLMIVNGMVRDKGLVQPGFIQGLEDGNGADGTINNRESSSATYNSSHWWESFMPKGAFGPGGDPWNLTKAGLDKNSSFGFQMDMFAEGYGYSFRRSTASRVSIAILLVQLAIASCFIIYTIATGTSSSSWDSPAELIALALASEAPTQPADRKGLATGEASIESLQKLYCVKADGNRLQLTQWTGKVPDGNRVKPNTVYE